MNAYHKHKKSFLQTIWILILRVHFILIDLRASRKTKNIVNFVNCKLYIRYWYPVLHDVIYVIQTVETKQLNCMRHKHVYVPNYNTITSFFSLICFYCIRHVNNIMKHWIWEPVQGKRKPGRPRHTYVDQLRDDTGLEKHHLKERMQNREEWRGRVKYVRASCSA